MEERNNLVKLCITNGDAEGWSGSTHTEFVVSMSETTISVEHIKGRDMFTTEVFSAVCRILQVYNHIYGVTYKYDRKSKFRYTFREGMSGCEDTYIEWVSKDNRFPNRKFLFHTSCFGKTGGMVVFKYDLLDYLLLQGILYLREEEDTGRKYYAYDLTSDPILDQEFFLIDPRDIDKEEGWASDIEDAHIVPLIVHRGQLIDYSVKIEVNGNLYMWYYNVFSSKDDAYNWALSRFEKFISIDANELKLGNNDSINCSLYAGCMYNTSTENAKPLKEFSSNFGDNSSISSEDDEIEDAIYFFEIRNDSGDLLVTNRSWFSNESDARSWGFDSLNSFKENYIIGIFEYRLYDENGSIVGSARIDNGSVEFDIYTEK